MDLEVQLRAAEARRAELERQHQQALAELRACTPDTLEGRQSRVRELEKKVALETVRCEELQLELASSHRNRTGVSSTGGLSMSTNTGGCHSQWSHSSSTNKGTEIERIMAKIEQDNRILAELDHSRSTTLDSDWISYFKQKLVAERAKRLLRIEKQEGAGLATSASSHALGECSPPVSPITMSHTTPSIYPTSTTLGGHNSYQPGGGYLPSTCNPPLSYNPSSQYNSLGGHHHYTSNKPSLMGGTSGLHHSTVGSLGTTLTGGGVLGGNIGGHQSSLATSMGLGTLPSSVLGTSMVPSTGYATCSVLSNTTFSNPLVSTNPASSSLVSTSYPTQSFSNPATGTLNQYSLPSYNPVTTSSFTNNVTFSNPLSSQFNSLPISAQAMSIKLNTLDEVDLGTRRVATPVTPHPPGWGMGGTSLTGMTDTRPRMMTDGLDSDWSGIHTSDRNYLNGHNSTDGQVDMLDIPGKGRCSVYIARFSYEPEPDVEEELSIQTGDYLLVWGEPVGPGGYLDAETLDGRRGLVPSHFVQRLIGDDLLEFHQAVLSTLREEEINQENFAADVQRLNELAEMSETQEDDGPEGEEVPAPRQLTLERQLNKSVLISWTTPDVGPGNNIESYHVYVDGVLKTTIKATERTRALVEGVDSNRPHRISVRSVTTNRRTSRDAACTMIIGRDTHQLGPSAVRATNITSTSAVISWLPANSNHQHVVCVNNVEVRTVKPGVYRHTITGLAPNTQYRVTVRAKHHRAASNIANLAEDLPMPAAAHTDFRTLPKGLPDPPSDIQVEPGPQDGTLLVTWHPITAPHHQGSTVTGYAVYADGKKVTDVDSPTGDHALIDISKLLGLNPKHVTVRTKARDSQSADSLPTAIPLSVLRGGAVKARQQPHSAVMPAHIRQQMPRQQQQQQGQQVIEPDENLSDKEIFPNSSSHRQQGGIPSIEDEMLERRQQQRGGQYGQHQQRGQGQGQRGQQGQQGQQTRMEQQQQQQQQQQQYYQQQQAQQIQRGGNMNMRGNPQMQVTRPGQNNVPNNPNNPPNPQKRARWFVALFDYDPSTMSPNPDACDEELPFSEGDTIKVWGDKDADGFYWGECRGRRGYVPHNMVMEVEGNQNRDRWGDIYANMPVKRMVALYDYDPQELSPNVDAEVELSFQTGQVINVYGEMDDDGFYMGEIDGVRGLVPSNFLAESVDQYGGAQGGQAPGVQGSMGRGRGQRGIGPGARGPPPPPRETTMRGRNKDACPTVLTSQLDNVNTAPPVTQVFTDHHQGRGRGTLRAVGNQQSLQQSSPQQQQPGQIQQQPYNQSYGTQQQYNSQQQYSHQQQYNNQQQHQQQQQQLQQQQTTQNTSSGGIFGGAQTAVSGLFSSSTQSSGAGIFGGGTQSSGGGIFGGGTQSSGGGIFGSGNQNVQSASTQQSFVGQQQQASRMQMKGVPQVVPSVVGQNMQNPQNNPQNPAVGAPNLMQKLNEMTAPGGDILSKGKELIFMKFGLGGGK